ncbi:Lsr2-like DNA bridging protein [Mycobacterium phage Gail]|uniref:Lsr2-like DNA bridging protein n=1 Tax=Mycobacterium phage Gail TaxID=2743994 RepID=A0A7D5JG17_9CAUD|nr:nucloid associated Lsr2-like [Mycobacterium phage Gail]QLF84598.1 Lsr2-like DNA bridging protein [Mycobacterium phage Gail]
MASELIVRTTDDFDRSKIAEEKAVIGWDGYDYTLDLTKAHYRELVKTLEPYLQAAHSKVKQKRVREKKDAPKRYAPISLGKEERAAVREWARNNGWEIGDKGIIKAEIVDAYTKAHSG